MELIPEVEELELIEAATPTAPTWGDGADGTEGFPEEVRETVFGLAEPEAGTLLLFILLAAMWSLTEFTWGFESVRNTLFIDLLHHYIIVIISSKAEAHTLLKYCKMYFVAELDVRQIAIYITMEICS